MDLPNEEEMYDKLNSHGEEIYNKCFLQLKDVVKSYQNEDLLTQIAVIKALNDFYFSVIKNLATMTIGDAGEGKVQIVQQSVEKVLLVFLENLTQQILLGKFKSSEKSKSDSFRYN
jgi:ABC-type glutathione transport system ATPase component